MNCPSCGTELKVGDRQGVEIDYCPSCRGVWLDRGELDKIIDRLSSAPWAQDRDFERPPEREDASEYRKRKRKRSLSELFEFGD